MAVNVNDMRERRKVVAKQARELMDSTAGKDWNADNQVS